MADPNILKRNQLALSSFDPRLSSVMAAVTACPGIRYISSRTGLPVPAREMGGSLIPLHSKYDPIREGAKLVGIYGKSGYLVFLGLGAGYQILPFLACKGVSHILIIDRDLGLFKSVMENIDLRSLIIDHRVRFLIDRQPGEIKDFILENYIPSLDGDLKSIPLYTRLNNEKQYFQDVVSSIREIISRVADDYTVQVQFGKKWFTNTIINLEAAQAATCLLKPARKVLVTGAGPSLEMQIPEIKQLKKGGFLIATDTSLPALLGYGILPDIVISIDCQQISYHHFIQGLPDEVPLVLDLASPPILTRLSKQIIFFSSGHPFSKYVTNHWRMFPAIDTSGGNVSHAALSLASSLGAERIYLFGLDFSFPEGKTYARDTYQYQYFRTREHRFLPLESSFFTSIFTSTKVIKEQVPGYIRYTTKPMINYKERMENAIRQLDSRVIQAGGKGIPLVIRQQTVKKQVVTFKKIFAQGPPAMGWRDFLAGYLGKIRNLKEPYFPIIKYLNDLSNHQRDLWTTQYPAAASIRRQALTDDNSESAELLRQTRQWTIARIEERLSQ